MMHGLLSFDVRDSGNSSDRNLVFFFFFNFLFGIGRTTDRGYIAGLAKGQGAWKLTR